MKKLILSTFLFFSVSVFARTNSDTLKKYDNGQLLLKQNNRFELWSGDSLISHWERMEEVITVNKISYQVIMRSINGQWKKGLFSYRQGRLFLQPEHEIVNRFFYFPDLVYVKDEHGAEVFSVITGKRTGSRYSRFRQMGDKYCLGFNDWGMYVYDKSLQLIDSLAGIQFEGYQAEYGASNFLYMKTDAGYVFIDDQFKIIPTPQWTKISRLVGELLVVETSTGQGVFHTGLRKMITPTDFDPFSYEMHEDRFTFYKKGVYYLHDSLGNILASVRAKGMSCVDDLKAFFYYQDDKFGIMNGDGKILQSPLFDDFNTSSQPIGYFIARIKGEKEHKRYAWVYTLNKGEKTITGIKLLGIYKETDTNQQSWPPNQPVEMKQE